PLKAQRPLKAGHSSQAAHPAGLRPRVRRPQHAAPRTGVSRRQAVREVNLVCLLRKESSQVPLPIGPGPPARGESLNAATGNSTVRVPKAGEMVAAHLRRQIVLGELKEGDQLPAESVLMEEFGVSRPTLREAFRILEAEGSITVRRGVRGGARVQVPDIGAAARSIGLLLQYRGALLSDVYEVRAVLEPAAARMAARRRTSADLARLQEALDRHRESLDDPGKAFAADAEFHRLVVELSGNETLQILVGMLTNIIREGDRSYA